MSEKEEKGFTVVDRRRFGADGDATGEQSEKDGDGSQRAEAADRTATGSRHEAAGGRAEGAGGRAEGSGGRSEIDFGTFVMSLASSVLFHLGELVPEGQEDAEAHRSLPLAKQHQRDERARGPKPEARSPAHPEPSLIFRSLFSRQKRQSATSG